ncbi:hypothetical protein F5B20DRAFT_588874 [Whalleya microplaca]|nr:hypothetical protein F5B20DRAFT_588874 [Whalleya microplaca]
MPRICPFPTLFARKDKNSPVAVSITAREPVPLERGRPSIAHLPDNIVRRILSFVQDSSSEDILTVASLSSSLYTQARYVQHRVVHIDLDKSNHAHNSLDLITYRGLLPAIRVLVVNGKQHVELQEEGKALLARLAGMLPGMTGLRDLHWKVAREIHWTEGRTTTVPIPTNILDSLPVRLRLHTSIVSDERIESHSQVREFLARLTSNQNLFTISVHILFICGRECLKTMTALKKVILSCPNLRRIPRIHVWYPPDHGVNFGPEFGAPYCGLGFANGERPPALEELGVARYPWGSVNKHPFSIHCRGYPEEGQEWEYWADKFDWSRLLRLNTLHGDMVESITPKLTSLREAVFDDGNAYGFHKTAFLDGLIAPLEFLSICNWVEIGKPETITQHGATLRKLKIHQLEGLYNADSYVTDEDLAKLCNGLPRLEELAIDIARDENANDWPYGALDAIAKFPRLRTVELWFKLGWGSTPIPAPYITVSSARYLFDYLRKEENNIQRLILHSGAPGYGFLHRQYCGEPPWSEQNCITLVCNMVYHSDAQQGVFSVTCPSLSKELNVELNRLAQQDDRNQINLKELDEKSLPLKIALDGPLTMDEWKTWRHQQWVRRRKAYRQQNSMLGRFIIGPLKRAWK